MPKHIHILRENIFNIPIGIGLISNHEANALLASGDAIEVSPMPLPQQPQETPPTIIVQQSDPPLPKTTTIKRNRKQGPMKTPKFSNSLKSKKS